MDSESSNNSSGKRTPLETSAPIRSHRKEPNWPQGFRPWGSLVGCFFLMWNAWGLVNAYGTFSSFYYQHLLRGRDFLLIMLIGSTQSFLVLLFSMPVGRLLDAGHARSLILLGSAFATGGMLLLSVVNSKSTGLGEGNYGLMWLTQGLLVGLGMSCFFVSSSQVVSTWFTKRKAVALGIVSAGASCGGTVYPFMTKYLITQLGFNNAVRCVSGGILFTCLISIFLAVPNPESIRRKPAKWSSVKVWIDVQVLKNGPFCWLAAGVCFMFFGYYCVFFILEDWAAHKGFGVKDKPPGLDLEDYPQVKNDAIRTFWLLSILSAASAFGRVVSGVCADFIGALQVTTITNAIGCLLIFALWTQTNSLGPALVFVIVYGVISGALIATPPACVAQVLGRLDAEQQAKMGQWIGMMYSAAAPFALAGPLIAGHLVSAYHESFLAVQAWSGACLFMGALCIGISWTLLGRQKKRSGEDDLEKSGDDE